MTQIKKLIAQICSKKSIKIWSVFLFIIFLFLSKVYASSGGETVDNIAYYLHLLLSLASWVWIILANLAGKLMTNDILYGSFLNLDASLWTLWNIMKNFANFALGFMVLYAIVQNVFSGPFGNDSGERSPIKVIKKTLIAGILIQSSWFLMGAMVDISTIMTSSIGSFPSQFIASDNNFRGHMHSNLKSLTKTDITFNPSDEQNIVTFKTGQNFDDDDIKKLLDTITPSYNSLAGPLLFIGFAVFDFNDFENFSVAGQSSVNSIDQRGDLFLSLGLSAMIIVFFSLMMFFIFMFNLFRLLILWILIPILPIIVLFKVFNITEKLGGGSKGMDLSKFMDIKTIVMLVFKPVFMVLSLSVILVILVLIKGIISPSGNKIGQVLLEDHGNVMIETVGYASGNNNLYTSTIKSDGIMEFSISGVKQTFADIIVYLFGLFLMYFLVRMVVSINTGIGFIDNAMTNTFKTFEKLLINLPIIPVAGGRIGISAAKEADISQAATRLAGIDVNKQMTNINKLLGGGNTFSNLHIRLKKDEWISSAVTTAKSLQLNSNTIFTDKEFRNKWDEWNTSYKTNAQNQIQATDITMAFDDKSVNASKTETVGPDINSSETGTET